MAFIDENYLHAFVTHKYDYEPALVTRLRPMPDCSGCSSAFGAQPLLTQTILIFHDCFAELIFCEDGHGRIWLEPRAQPGPVHSLGQPHPLETYNVHQALWDPFSSAVILVTHTSLILLAHDNTLCLLAGEEGASASNDGDGITARFKQIERCTTDGAGCLYVADRNRIRRVRLPPSLQGRWHSAATVGDIAAAVPDITVTTLPFRAVSTIRAVVYQPGTADGSPSSSSSSSSSGGSLVFATWTALYRVALSTNNTGDGDGDGDEEPVGTLPELLAGAEGSEGRQDGPGPCARFTAITGIVADSRGCLYIDEERRAPRLARYADSGISVRKVEQQQQQQQQPGVGVGGGPPVVTVTTLIDRIATGDTAPYPAILPCGYLACTGSKLVLIDLKLQPVRLTASAAIAAAADSAPPPRTLPDDLGALLDRQPDGTADVTLLVGDRSFAAHRAILAARSDYFRQRLTGGAFVDSREQQLSLPEADPEAFAHVLRFIYTGRVGGTLSGQLARPVAELADRLLLPELCREAQARVLAEVNAENVVDCLLWAEAQGGGSFSQLLADLKAWYLEHKEEVVERAQPSLMRLMSENPGLMLQLLVLDQRGGR